MLLLISTIQVIVLVISELYQFNNLPLYHVYVLLEFNLIASIFYYQIFQRKEKSFWIWIASMSVIALFTNHLWIQNFTSFPSILRSVESVLIIAMVVAYFMNLLRRAEVIRLSLEPAFWMSCGLFIYYMTNMLLFLYGDMVIEQSPRVFDYIWTMHGYFNILLYSFYTIALLCRKKS